MLPPVNSILALDYAWKVSIALIVVFGVVFPLIVQGLLMFAGGVAKGEQAANDAYEEKITARK
jgi:hypothetical protein